MGETINAYLSKRALANGSMKIEVIQVDCAIEINRFGKAAAHNSSAGEGVGDAQSCDGFKRK